MNTLIRKAFIALLVVAPAIASAHAEAAAAQATRPTRCSVTDMTAFQSFIAGKPTVAEFRASYSCVALILPNDVATMEMRYDNSRYFAELDKYGRIVGGSFR